MEKQQLTKSNDRVLLGVCGGIAEFIGWPKLTVRVLWVLFTFMFLGIFAYPILAFIMPSAPKKFNLDEFRKE
ncbi:Hypothetical protein I595_3044 [Croceitalea dokdonensis DOKDO 023]|uniref:Phage shock protein PspC N-terminal domain-containing protein n=1 Tax=Croceitalea dokdonensis DOKDO 023 TaxID=1300341 RepID=A0A0P7ASX2_9FLAO|nr:PspC domain-containing protein [Croceitalea dokdonensis]KPM31065.1 Hypothetical protein I595_3044 [Croceitalea dokdonensis DOKDO 023]